MKAIQMKTEAISLEFPITGESGTIVVFLRHSEAYREEGKLHSEEKGRRWVCSHWGSLVWRSWGWNRTNQEGAPISDRFGEHVQLSLVGTELEAGKKKGTCTDQVLTFLGQLLQGWWFGLLGELQQRLWAFCCHIYSGNCIFVHLRSQSARLLKHHLRSLVMSLLYSQGMRRAYTPLLNGKRDSFNCKVIANRLQGKAYPKPDLSLSPQECFLLLFSWQ